MDRKAFSKAVQLCITSFMLYEDTFVKSVIVLRMWLTDDFPIQNIPEPENIQSELQSNSHILQTMCEPDFISANNDASKSEQQRPNVENLSSEDEDESGRLR